MIAHRVGKGGIGAAQESPPKRGVKCYSDISNNRTSATEIQALSHYLVRQHTNLAAASVVDYAIEWRIGEPD